MFRRYFIFKNACFFLFLGYVARYAPYEKQINILFLLYKKPGDINLNSFLVTAPLNPTDSTDIRKKALPLIAIRGSCHVVTEGVKKYSACAEILFSVTFSFSFSSYYTSA